MRVGIVQCHGPRVAVERMVAHGIWQITQLASAKLPKTKQYCHPMTSPGFGAAGISVLRTIPVALNFQLVCQSVGRL